MFGPQVVQESFAKAMKHYDAVKKNRGSEREVVAIAIEWYLTYEEMRHGIMS